MLKKLSPRHREVIRRLVIGETPAMIEEDLGISRATLSVWAKDPEFQSGLVDLQHRMEERIINDPDRLSAIEVLKSAAHDAAMLCKNTLESDDADLNLKLKTAWDILDRTEGKPTQRQHVTTLSLTDLILTAHREMLESEESELGPETSSRAHQALPERS
jgi:hypothetical protein